MCFVWAHMTKTPYWMVIDRSLDNKCWVVDNWCWFRMSMSTKGIFSCADHNSATLYDQVVCCDMVVFALCLGKDVRRRVWQLCGTSVKPWVLIHHLWTLGLLSVATQAFWQCWWQAQTSRHQFGQCYNWLGGYPGALRAGPLTAWFCLESNLLFMNAYYGYGRERATL